MTAPHPVAVFSLHDCLSKVGMIVPSQASHPGKTVWLSAATAVKSTNKSASADGAHKAWERVIEDNRLALELHVASIESASSPADVYTALVKPFQTAAESSNAESGSNKRKRTAPKSEGAVAASATSQTLASIPSCLVRAAIQQCAQQIASSVQASNFDAAGDGLACVQRILRIAAVSHFHVPSFLSDLLKVCTSSPAGTKGLGASSARSKASKTVKATPAATGPALNVNVTAIETLLLALDCMSDIPENVLVKILTTFVKSISASVWELYWTRIRIGTGATHAETASLGILHALGILAKVARNDVFLEQALHSLSPEEAWLLLAFLHQLYTYAGSGSAITAVSDDQTSTQLKLASPGQILDWIRMVVDAQFLNLAISTRGADGKLFAQVLASLARTITEGEVDCEALAVLRGTVSHLISRAPMPTPPPPAHIVEQFEL
jgi:hypothetical protein